jgi:hypothetical protein
MPGSQFAVFYQATQNSWCCLEQQEITEKKHDRLIDDMLNPDQADDSTIDQINKLGDVIYSPQSKNFTGRSRGYAMRHC